MTDKNGSLTGRVTRADWIPAPPPVDATRILAAATRRRRRRRTALVTLSAAAVVLVAGGTLALSRHTESQTAPKASVLAEDTDDVVPWSDAKPAEESGPASECTARQLDAELGNAGAWHGNATQAINIINRGDACELPAKVTVTALDTTEAADIGTTDERTLGSSQSAILLIGSPADCASAKSLSDTSVTIGFGSDISIQLDGATLAEGCGSVTPLSVSTVAQDPATESVPVSAQITAPDSASPGSVLVFTVTLTNGSKETVSWEVCPSYRMSLKPAGASAHYILNCREIPRLEPGESREYEMRLDIPESAEGDQILTWVLSDYPANASTQLSID